MDSARRLKGPGLPGWFSAPSERPGGGVTDSDCSAAVLFMNYSFAHDEFFTTLRFSVRGWEVLKEADY